jgi:hypothetical protein
VTSQREQKILKAIEDAKSKWDEKYSQEDWTTLNTPAKEIDPDAPVEKWRRVGKGFASKAMKNAY